MTGCVECVCGCVCVLLGEVQSLRVMSVCKGVWVYWCGCVRVDLQGRFLDNEPRIADLSFFGLNQLLVNICKRIMRILKLFFFFLVLVEGRA